METLVQPPRGRVSIGFGELWKYRELLYFLAWRDLKVRYKQTFLGVAWALLQPLAMMTIFTIFLGHLGHMPSEGFPYSIFTLAGLLPWTFFANATGGASDSVVAGANLVSKVYFPRLILPIGATLSWLVDLLVGVPLLLGMMAIYGVALSWTVVLAPVFVLFALLTSLGVGTWLAALNVAYRDIKYTVPYLLQLWLFATPVVWTASTVPERFQWLLGLNPMAGVVTGFRWALLGGTRPSTSLLLSSAAVTLVLLVTGFAYFRNMERYFADVI